jgi:Amt family ammonium transporter
MKWIIRIAVFTTSIAVSAPALFAQETAATTSKEIHSPADFVWILATAFLVFFMQAGFAMVETGFTRAKNAGNIMMKNLFDFCMGSIAFFIIGYGIMFGATRLGLFGTNDFLLSQGSPQPDADGGNGGLWQYAYFLFQLVFAATAATIVSGAMAERTKFIAYLIYSLVISAVIYPVSGHWIWNASGWLAKLGFQDFAGSTVVQIRTGRQGKGHSGPQYPPRSIGRIYSLVRLVRL